MRLNALEEYFWMILDDSVSFFNEFKANIPARPDGVTGFLGLKVVEQGHERSFAAAYGTGKQNSLIEVQFVFSGVLFIPDDVDQELEDDFVICRVNDEVITKEFLPGLLLSINQHE